MLAWAERGSMDASVTEEVRQVRRVSQRARLSLGKTPLVVLQCPEFMEGDYHRHRAVVLVARRAARLAEERRPVAVVHVEDSRQAPPHEAVLPHQLVQAILAPC